MCKNMRIILFCILFLSSCSKGGKDYNQDCLYYKWNDKQNHCKRYRVIGKDNQAVIKREVDPKRDNWVSFSDAEQIF